MRRSCSTALISEVISGTSTPEVISESSYQSVIFGYSNSEVIFRSSNPVISGSSTSEVNSRRSDSVISGSSTPEVISRISNPEVISGVSNTEFPGSRDRRFQLGDAWTTSSRARFTRCLGALPLFIVAHRYGLGVSLLPPAAIFMASAVCHLPPFSWRRRRNRQPSFRNEKRTEVTATRCWVRERAFIADLGSGVP